MPAGAVPAGEGERFLDCPFDPVGVADGCGDGGSEIVQRQAQCRFQT